MERRKARIRRRKEEVILFFRKNLILWWGREGREVVGWGDIFLWWLGLVVGDDVVVGFIYI